MRTFPPPLRAALLLIAFPLALGSATAVPAAASPAPVAAPADVVPAAPAGTLPACLLDTVPSSATATTAASHQLMSTNKAWFTRMTAKGYTRKPVDWRVATTARRGTVAVHRLYRAASKDYLYTYFPAEIASAKARYGYVDQGTVFHAGSYAGACANTPVYEGLSAKRIRRYATSTAELRAAGFIPGTAPKFFVKRGAAAPSPQPTPAPTPRPAPTSAPAPPGAPPARPTQPGGKPAAVLGTPYLNTGTAAYWASRNTTDPAKKLLYWQIGGTPSAAWYAGTSASDDSRLAKLVASARASNTVPQIVLYGIPRRDCGYLSAGGHTTAASYKAWIERTSRLIGDSRAVVIVEPDAISYCGWARTDPRRLERGELLRHVGATFAANNPNAALYLHAGSGQLGQQDAAAAVIDGGITYMRGFALNVASHTSTPALEAWGERFVTTLAGKGVANRHYVVDTGRNGLGMQPNLPNSQFASCNNPHIAVGTRPTSRTTGAHADAYLWAKPVGESDGVCHPGDPGAGVFFPELAESVVQNALDHKIIQLQPHPAGQPRPNS